VPLLPKKQKIFFARQELASCQFQDQRLVERGDGQELEAVQTLDDRELRLPDAALDGATIAVQQFQLGQAQQISRIIHLFGGALPGHLVVLTQDGWQPQGLQMMFEQHLRCIRGRHL